MIEIFDGILRFDKYIIVINTAIMIIYLCDWYFFYLRTGRNFSYWYYISFLYFFVPYLIMYPFVASPLNSLSVGSTNSEIISENINKAYYLSLLGYFMIFFGKHLYNSKINVLPIKLFVSLLSNTIGKLYSSAINDDRVARHFTYIYLFILLIFIIFIANNGLIGNPRGFFMANPSVRPIYNFIISTYSLFLSFNAFRAIHMNTSIEKILTIFLIILGMFLGIRAPLFLEGFTILVVYIIFRKNGFFAFTKLFISLSICLFFIISYAIARNYFTYGELSNNSMGEAFALEIFYGNTFSDLRDFSWVLGYWDGDYLWGLSYLSALMSFIPSSLSSFREVYSIGKFTVNILGMDTSIHPGVRPGMFGEAYFNFGIIGIAVLGVSWGYIYARASAIIDKAAKNNDIFKAARTIIYSIVINHFVVSASFFSLYSILLVLVAMYFYKKINFTAKI